MSATELYWITRLDALGAAVPWLFWVPLFASLAYSGFLGMIILEDTRYETYNCVTDEQIKKLMFLWGVTVVLLIVVLVIETLLPSTKDMLIIQGIDRLSNSPEVKNLVGLIYERLQSLIMVK